MAFNTSHEPQMVGLPKWEGRVWAPLVDTGKAAPYDILVADERLPEEEVAAARAAAAMWTLEHAYPMLPWSCVVLESVPAGVTPEMPAARTKELEEVVGEPRPLAGVDGGGKAAPKRGGRKPKTKAEAEE